MGQPTSIRRALLRSSKVLAAVCVLIAVAATWLVIDRLVYLNRMIVLIADAGRLALMVRRADAASHRPFEVDVSTARLTGQYHGTAADSYFQVWAADGTTLAKSPSLADDDLTRPHLPESVSGIWASPTAADRGLAEPRTENQDLEVIELTLANGEAATLCWIRYSPLLGPSPPQNAADDDFVVIAVARPHRSDTQLVNSMRWAIAAAGVIALLMFRLLAGLFIARGLRPLRTLETRVASIDIGGSRDGAEQRLSADQLSTETLPIAHAINALLAHTSRVLDQERRFSQNAAHELRTPLAEIRATADMAQRADPATQQAALRTISESVAQMNGVLRTLVNLTRPHEPAVPGDRSPLAIGDAIAELARRHAHALSSKRLTWRVDVPDNAMIRTDPAAFRTVVGNLIDNAVEYTAVGGSIGLAATSDGQRWTLLFRNGPTSLDDSDIHRLGTPFWRRDLSRGRGNHSGLGLALARTLIESLGGDITFSLDARALTVKLTLPVHD